MGFTAALKKKKKKIRRAKCFLQWTLDLVGTSTFNSKNNQVLDVEVNIILDLQKLKFDNLVTPN